MSDRKRFGTIENTDTNRVHIDMTEYKGKKYLDVRKYFDNDKGEKDIPTKKGITIATNSISDFINVLEKVEAEGVVNGNDE